MTAQDLIFEKLLSKIQADPEFSVFNETELRRSIFVGTNRPSHPNSGKQLTKFGFKVASKYFKCTSGEVTSTPISKLKLMKFDNFLNGAWYLDEITFAVFTQSDFMFFALSGGDLDVFFDLIKH